MIMFSGLLRQLPLYENCMVSETCVAAMAEDESQTNSQISNSKDTGEEGWLQLGVGDSSMESNQRQIMEDPTASKAVELDLFSGGGSSSSTTPNIDAARHRSPRQMLSGCFSSHFLGHPPPHIGLAIHDTRWEIRATQPCMTAAVSSSSPPHTVAIPALCQLSQPVRFHIGGDEGGPSSFVRPIDAPRRSGIWCMLQALNNRGNEPFLPQITKSYLRIRDGGMTVRLLIKYLVGKLGISNESEIEIKCRGQVLQPFLTLQHVRDNMWRQREAVTLLQDTPTTDHVMLLTYARTA